jgi:hypothetical protein
VIDVWKDMEGARLALEEIFEEDFLRAHLVRQMEHASPETRERIGAQVPPRKLAWGYYRFADYLLELDVQRTAGVGVAERDLLAFEVKGLVALDRARKAFEGRHPACNLCNRRQVNRFGAECSGCGAKFQRKTG